MRILLVKPYQELERPIQSPPLGLLHLAATVRERFGSDADVSVIDMKAKALPPAWLSDRLKELAPDVVGVSALNCEASASAEIASVVKKYDSNILTVLGGPYAHRRGEEILRKTDARRDKVESASSWENRTQRRGRLPVRTHFPASECSHWRGHHPATASGCPG